MGGGGWIFRLGVFEGGDSDLLTCIWEREFGLVT